MYDLSSILPQQETLAFKTIIRKDHHNVNRIMPAFFKNKSIPKSDGLGPGSIQNIF